ncbi:MAG TPA: MEDS domain-containing protein [Nitrososphaeraceae archaeon]|nr:MEDS domain-containing protein [Nitrososphaeraceae archaeon]
MGRKDWYYVHLPKLLIKRLDQFLQTPKSKAMGITNKPELLRHVVNKFLDEQEVFYNKIDYIEDFILEMKDRDHVALPFDNECQFKEIVNAFIKRGINCYQINVLLIYKKEEQKFLESLNKIPNINSLFNSGEITIIPAEESAHYDTCWFDPVLKRLYDIVLLAKNNSKAGLNVLGTFPGQLTEQGRYSEAMELENTFTRAIKGSEMPITAICLYKSIPAILDDRLPEYHDLIIKRTTA